MCNQQIRKDKECYIKIKKNTCKYSYIHEVRFKNVVVYRFSLPNTSYQILNVCCYIIILNKIIEMICFAIADNIVNRSTEQNIRLHLAKLIRIELR